MTVLSTVKVEFEWSFPIPKYGSDRMGIYDSGDGPVFQIQVEPRVLWGSKGESLNLNRIARSSQ